MARYTLEDDDAIFDTDKAKRHWAEDTRWNGNNHVSLATGSQHDHEKLWLTSKGRFVVEWWSAWQGSVARARLLEPRDAARWLMTNGHDLPADLAELEGEISE